VILYSGHFCITQEVSLLKFNIFQYSTTTTYSINAFPPCWYYKCTKLYSTKEGCVYQWHNAHDPSYSLCHWYISLMVSLINLPMKNNYNCPNIIWRGKLGQFVWKLDSLYCRMHLALQTHPQTCQNSCKWKRLHFNNW